MGTHINPIQGYKFNQSIRLHFCKEKYNLFKNGLVKINPKTFDKRSDRNLYRHITSKLDGSDVIYYFLSNTVCGNNYPLTDFDGEGTRNFKNFQRKRESLTHIFNDEICNASLDVTSFDDLIESHNGNQPLIIRYLIGGIISIETFCLIQLCCYDIINIDYSDYLWDSKKDFIKKYIDFFENGFILYNQFKIKSSFDKTFKGNS